MFREIKKRQIILENRKPYNKQISDYITELDKSDWICSSLRMNGSALTKTQIEKMMKGEFIEDAPLSAHALIEKYSRLFKTARDMLQMSSSFNKDMLFTFAKILSEDDNISYRRTNPVLVSLNYNPPHPSEIAEQVDLLMTWFYSDDMSTNPVRKAACLHHRIIEIYPFESITEDVARSAMYYFLMEQGFHPFELNLGEREYNISITEYLKKENLEPFYNAVESSLFTKMEIIVQLTKDKTPYHS